MSDVAKAKESATFWLKDLKGDDPAPYMISILKSNLRDGNLKPQDIGTTDWEIRYLDKRSYFFKARYWLKELRSTDTSDYIISLLIDAMKNADASFEDIGTTESEFKELCRLTKLKEAKEWLAILKRQPNSLNLNIFLKYAEEANAELSDLGMTQKEFNILSHNAESK